MRHDKYRRNDQPRKDEEMGLGQSRPEAHDKGYSVWCTDAGKNMFEI